jgi:hypothetical protein
MLRSGRSEKLEIMMIFRKKQPFFDFDFYELLSTRTMVIGKVGI